MLQFQQHTVVVSVEEIGATRVHLNIQGPREVAVTRKAADEAPRA